jgi:hypothetical protein
LKESPNFKNLWLNISEKGILNDDILTQTSSLIRDSKLSFDDLKLITKTLVEINKMHNVTDKKRWIENLIEATGDSISKVR